MEKYFTYNKLLFILFFIIAIIHFIVVFPYTNLSPDGGIIDKILYVLIKIISFIIIVILWQLIPIIYTGFKNNNYKIVNYTKHTLIYFSCSLVILILTYPLLIPRMFINTIEIPSTMLIIKHSFFETTWFINWLTGFIWSICYNIVPSIKFITIFCMFLYSLVFAYLLVGIKEHISEKYANLLYIPFCIPFVLMINHIAYKNLYSFYLFIFLLSFILFNQNAKIKKFLTVFIISIFSAMLVSIRAENMTIILLLPLMIYCFKIFSKQMFILFITLYFVFFGLIISVSKSFDNDTYALHNLIFAYENYVNTNNYTPDKETKILLSKAYNDVNSFKNNGVLKSDLNHEDNKKIMKYITLFIVKHFDFYLKNNIITSHKEINSENLLVPENNINLDDYPKQKEIGNFLIFNPNKYPLISIFYSPFVSFILLLILLTGGIITKKYFYVWFFAIETIVITFFYIYMPLYMYQYFLFLVFGTLIFSFVFLIELIELKSSSK